MAVPAYRTKYHEHNEDKLKFWSPEWKCVMQSWTLQQVLEQNFIRIYQMPQKLDWFTIWVKLHTHIPWLLHQCNLLPHTCCFDTLTLYM
jgi:hypothetical protein